MKVAFKHRKRQSSSLITREIRIKTMLRYYFSFITLGDIQILIIYSVGETVSKYAVLYIAGSNINQFNHFGGKFDNKQNYIFIYHFSTHSYFLEFTLKVYFQQYKSAQACGLLPCYYCPLLLKMLLNSSLLSIYPFLSLFYGLSVRFGLCTTIPLCSPSLGFYTILCIELSKYLLI